MTMDYYAVKFGARVLTEQGYAGTIIHVGTGSLAGTVEVRLDDGRVVTERSYTLRALGLCSDETLADDDAIRVERGEVGCPVTTDADVVRKHVAGRGVRVVFKEKTMGDSETKTGTLKGFYGSMGSGIARLEIETEDGVEIVNCENGPTGRALTAMFGSIQDAIDSQIQFTIGDFGLLESIGHPED